MPVSHRNCFDLVFSAVFLTETTESAILLNTMTQTRATCESAHAPNVIFQPGQASQPGWLCLYGKNSSPPRRDPAFAKRDLA